MSDPRVTLPKPKTPLLSLCHVITPNAALFDNRGLRNGLQTELLHGQKFKVYAEGRNWLWGQAVSLVKGSRRPGYVGYVPRKALSDAPFKASHIVSSLRALVFTKPDIKSHIIQALPMNARVSTKRFNADFLQIGAGAYIHTKHVSPLRGKPAYEDYVSIAEQFIGAPYVWGGTGHIGLDCSGLVQMALCAVGIDAPRDADMQEAQIGEEIEGSLKRGDLIFWPGHVGIMSDSRTLLHANAFHMATKKEPYKTALDRIGKPRRRKRL
jgi:cell wall-associated NlpC family hydrolase